MPPPATAITPSTKAKSQAGILGFCLIGSGSGILGGGISRWGSGMADGFLSEVREGGDEALTVVANVLANSLADWNSSTSPFRKTAFPSRVSVATGVYCPV